MPVKSRYELNIPGRRGDGRVLTVRSPFSGEKVGEVETVDEAGMTHALDAAERAFANRDDWVPAHERAEILFRLSWRIEKNVEALALQAAREGGKPLTDSIVEVRRAANTVRIAAQEATRFHGDEVRMDGTPAGAGRVAFTVREPIGVVAAVSAFNHPVNLIAHQAGAAVAAGCPVLVKPDTRTPLSCAAFIEMLHEAGLPSEWAMCVPCETPVAEKLVTSDRVGFFSFIGSAKVGWYLRSKVAPGVRCALEHGGIAPVIVDETADLDAAVPMLLKAGFYHAGQVCVSVQRVFAHEEVKEELARRLSEGARKLKVGDPAKADTEVGPIIDGAALDRIEDWVRKAVEGGAAPLCGAARLDHNCYAPTVLLDPPDDALVMNEEVFGPVVCVSGYRDLDEAIARANSKKWSFQSAVLTRDVGRAMRAAQRLDAAAVMINDHTAFRVDWMPFGGRKQSGLGVGGIPPAVAELTQEKLIVINTR